MKKYEMIREMFNSCENGRMRDIAIEEIEVEDVDAVIDEYRLGKNVECDKFVTPQGTIVVDINSDGLSQRITFTEM